MYVIVKYDARMMQDGETDKGCDKVKTNSGSMLL